MARPSKKESELISVRNDLILQCLKEGNGLNQSDVARIFRLPRNTVSVINRTKKNKDAQ